MIDNIYELKFEELDSKIRARLAENRSKFKPTNKEKLTEKIKENTLRMELERYTKSVEENNNVKTEIIMKEMYKQGFIDGSNLMMDVK